MLYQWLGGELKNFSVIHLQASLTEYTKTMLITKRAKVRYAYIEDKAAWERMDRVNQNADTEIFNGYTQLLSLISMIVRFVSLFSLLVAWAPQAVILILIICAPLMILAVKSGRASYEADQEVTQYVKRHKYLSEVMTGREYAEERTLFAYREHLQGKWFEQYERARKIQLRTQLKWFIRLKSGSIFVALSTVVISFLLLSPLFAGTLPFGMYAALVNGSFTLVHLVSWELMRSIDGLAKCRQFFLDYRELMSMEEEKDVLAMPIRGGSFEQLVFDHVYFRYPNTDHYVLKDLSFTMEKGKAYGIVGNNGAGKTTFVKLMTGLYRDYEGSIVLDGKELSEYAHSELKGRFAAVYQDFARYEISLFDNVSVGDVERRDESRVYAAAEQLHLTPVAEQLTHTWDTVLGKISEDGVDLSGGEWQRIALARAMINPAPVCILDEPTAALDPLAESNVYKEFEQIRKGRTTIFISHRLGSMGLTDKIFVFEDGHVSEAGNHQELMEKRGKYWQMYDHQRKWYQ
jgi:ATP-binding cassette subfamily B protein